MRDMTHSFIVQKLENMQSSAYQASKDTKVSRSRNIYRSVAAAIIGLKMGGAGARHAGTACLADFVSTTTVDLVSCPIEKVETNGGAAIQKALKSGEVGPWRTLR